MDFKNIHIGDLIKNRMESLQLKVSDLSADLGCTDKDVNSLLQAETVDSDLLLQFCKILEYDFFRIYTQHLILYAPSTPPNKVVNKTQLNIRKNIYTPEIIEFILELVRTEKKTKEEIITEYRIPKSTLHRWIKKYEK